jgi:hypothetical protein
MKRWKPTLIVLGIFAALLAYILLVETKREPPDEDAAPTPVPILAIDADDLQAIDISDGERALRMERRADGWRITAPDDAAVDESTLGLPLADLTQLEARMVVSDEVTDPATYGLDQGALTLSIETRSGEKERISVGRKTPDKTAFYVQHEGDPRLYISYAYELQPFFDWLSKPPYQPTPTPSAGG